jgi:Raf kinase inhibitor-like YbhB/YbcL family protein
MNTTISKLKIESPAFPDNGYLPSKYTCDGENISPPLTVGDLPKETKSLAIIMEDTDAPDGIFDHWVVWNIDPKPNIPENIKGGSQGKNGKQQTGYYGPCPPTGVHHYFFKIYALDKFLDLEKGVDKRMLLRTMHNHIIAGGEIVGLYLKKV